MISRILSVAIAITFFISVSLPIHASPAAQSQSQGTLTFSTSQPISSQGEIAYVLDGDIWLHDLVTNQAYQLTTDGNNMLPAWSSDGSMLLYSHGESLEETDLYVLDVSSGDGPSLVMENACCGGWSTKKQEFVFVDLSGRELAVRKSAIDIEGVSTILDPLIYGRTTYPLGNVVEMIDEENKPLWMIPLEYISDDGSLSIRKNLVGVNDGSINDIMTSETAPTLGCEVTGMDIHFKNDGFSSAVAFEGIPDQCIQALALSEKNLAPKGVGFGYVDRMEDCDELVDDCYVEDSHFLDWLASPTISSSNHQLAAEKYVPADDFRQAILWGVVVYDAETDLQIDVAEGASQPAWRPQPAVDQAATQIAKTDERVVTLTPALEYKGDTYSVSYLTTGDMTRTDAGIFHLPGANWISERQITGFVVTRNGELVTDPEELRHVFELYYSAYTLYTPPIMEFSTDIEQLDSLLVNAPLALMEPQQFLRPHEQQVQAALRALLTDQRMEDPLQPSFDQALADAPKTVGEAVNAFAAISKEQREIHSNLGAVSEDLERTFDKLNDTIDVTQGTLQAIRFLVQILFISHLREDRAEWLSLYAQSYSTGDGALDREQLRATAAVLDEVRDDVAQRVNRAVEVGTELLAADISNYGRDQVLQLAINFIASGGENLTRQAAASYLAALSIGVTVNSLLYNTDDAAVSLKLAQNNRDLNAVFKAGRRQVQDAVSAIDEPIAVYDGNLVEQFRVAYLLEGLAALQTQRAFADLASALVEHPNVLAGVTALMGEDWQAISEQLRNQADEMEETWLNTMANPNFIEPAVQLALERVSDMARSSPALTPNPLEIIGELAFVYEGNLYLLNVETGQTTQLTNTGIDARPAWSSDGRYLVFERVLSERTDLYLFDMETGEEQLFSKNACCAGWSSKRLAIGYISSAYDGQLTTENLDGSDQEFIDRGLYSRGLTSSPTGEVVWGVDNKLYVPIYTLMRGVADVNNGEPIAIDVIETFDLNRQYEIGGRYVREELDVPGIFDTPTCFYEPSASQIGTIALTRQQGCGNESAYDEILYRDEHNRWQVLFPGAQPSLSSDSTYIASVDVTQCKGNNTRNYDTCSAGIQVANLTSKETSLVIGYGTQPAWRPDASSSHARADSILANSSLDNALTPIPTPIAQEANESQVLLPFSFVIRDVGNGWNEGLVKIAYQYVSDDSISSFCLSSQSSEYDKRQFCIVETNKHIDVSEAYIDTREGKVYPVTIPTLYPQYASTWSLGFDPHRLPAGLIIDSGVEYTFRFSHAAHPIRLVIKPAAEQDYPDIVINLENVPEEIPRSDFSQYGDAKPVAALAELSLLDEPGKLRVGFTGTCFHFDPGKGLGWHTTIPYTIVNSNQFDEETGIVPYQFLAYYPPNGYVVTSINLGGQTVTAGPGQTVVEDYLSLSFRDMDGLAPSYMFVKADGENNWMLYKLDCE